MLKPMDYYRIAVKAKDVLFEMSKMTPEERQHFFYCLSRSFCPHCGENQPKGGCNCENDE
jgi:hypothetical protein